MNRFIGCFFSMFLLSGCSAIIDSRGHNPEAMDESLVIIAKSTKEDVQLKFGSPSIIAQFKGDDVWYYLSKKTATTSFFKPQIVEQKALRIIFDKKGLVKTKTTFENLNAVDLEPDVMRTESTGYEESISESLLDDFNRKFNSNKKKKLES